MTSTEQQVTGSSVLIVDDEEGIRELLEDILSDNGCQVALAASGEEALETMRQQSFDVLITDLNMPVMDGLALIAGLKEAQIGLRTKKVISTGALPGDMAQDDPRMQLVDAVLHKPFQEDELIALLDKFRADA